MATPCSEPPLIDQLRALELVPVPGVGMAYALPLALRDALIEHQLRTLDDGR